MFKIGLKYEDPDKYISNFLSEPGRGKLGRNILADVIQHSETNA